MRIRDWMSPDPMAISPSEPVDTAASTMSAYGIRHLPVVVGKRVVGMISDRDVRSAHDRATVAQTMSTPPHVIGADDSVEAAARLLLSRRISALPVVDDDGQMVGMITTTDCLLASLSASDGLTRT